MPSSVRLRSLGIQVCGRQHMFRKSSQAMVMVNMKTEKTIIEFGLGMAGYALQYSCLENSIEGEACGLQSMGSQRVGHNRVTNTHTHRHIINSTVIVAIIK